MSKAFTKENDDDVGEVAPDAPLLLPEGTRNYMTPAGAARFRAEHAALVIERGSLVPDTTAAAKSRLADVDRRLRFLVQRLDLLEVVDPANQANDRVVFGATVVVRDEANTTHRYRIVGIDEADPKNGLISWISPLAKTLLGHKVGDAVTFRTPRGNEDLEIESIEFT